MGIDGYKQAEYDQLVSDVRGGIPPTRPTLLVTLHLPRHKCPREITVSDTSSEIDEDDLRAAEVHDSF